MHDRKFIEDNKKLMAIQAQKSFFYMQACRNILENIPHSQHQKSKIDVACGVLSKVIEDYDWIPE